MRYIIVKNNKFNFIIYRYALNTNKIRIILLGLTILLIVLTIICKYILNTNKIKIISLNSIILLIILIIIYSILFLLIFIL